MNHFFEHHQVMCTLVGYALFSSMISGMPSPDDKSGKGYVWLFNTLHLLAANLGRIPQVRNLTTTLTSTFMSSGGDQPKP